jgi:catechol 2,3-dioxygenase-like lactoylglutathione lyase family enzyme
MKIKLTSVCVRDQEEALAFYTGVLGFEKKSDVPVGEEFRWLTVISPEGHDDVELLLEPLGFEPAKDFYGALYEAGIPANAFAVDDVKQEFEDLTAKGVAFRTEPMDAGGTMIAVFDDTVGNLIQIYEG